MWDVSEHFDSECTEMNLAEMNLTVKGRSQMMKRVGEKEDTMRRGEPNLQACLEFDDIHIGFVCIIFIIRSMKNKMHHKSNSVERMIR